MTYIFIVIFVNGIQFTWYESSHLLNVAISILSCRNVAQSCTDWARRRARVFLISFSTKVSHSFIFGWSVIDTGLWNNTWNKSICSLYSTLYNSSTKWILCTLFYNLHVTHHILSCPNNTASIQSFHSTSETLSDCDNMDGDEACMRQAEWPV